MLQYKTEKIDGEKNLIADRIGIVYPSFVGDDEHNAWKNLVHEIMGYADRRTEASFDEDEDGEAKREVFNSMNTYEDRPTSGIAFSFAYGLGWYSKKVDGRDDLKDYPESLVVTIDKMIAYAECYKEAETWSDIRKEEFKTIKNELVTWWINILQERGVLRCGYEFRIDSGRLNDTLSKLYTQKLSNGGKSRCRGVQWVKVNREQAFKHIMVLLLGCSGIVNYPKAKKISYARNF